MSITTAAYKIATGGALTTLTIVPPLTDAHVSITANDVLVPDWANKLVAVFAMGATLTGAQITTPSLREIAAMDFSPLNVAATPNSPPSFVDRFDYPLELKASEGLRAYITSGASENDYVVVFLIDKVDPVPAGAVTTVKYTGTTTVTANAWSQCALTPSQQLGAGQWGVVGVRALSTTGIAARLIIPGSPFRPGCIATASEGKLDGIGDQIRFRWGNACLMGTFPHTYPMQAEFLCTAADTAQTVYLDLVKVS